MNDRPEPCVRQRLLEHIGLPKGSAVVFTSKLGTNYALVVRLLPSASPIATPEDFEGYHVVYERLDPPKPLNG